MQKAELARRAHVAARNQVARQHLDPAHLDPAPKAGPGTRSSGWPVRTPTFNA